MKAILTARPWQIFIFVSAAPILVLVFMKQILNEPVAGPYIIVVAAFPWYGWLYVVGTNLFTISRFPRRATIVYMLLFIGIAFGFLLLALLPEERPITEQAVVGMLG